MSQLLSLYKSDFGCHPYVPRFGIAGVSGYYHFTLRISPVSTNASWNPKAALSDAGV